MLLLDRPGHGRSPYHPDIIGPTEPPFSYDRAREVYFVTKVSDMQTHVAVRSQWRSGVRRISSRLRADAGGSCCLGRHGCGPAGAPAGSDRTSNRADPLCLGTRRLAGGGPAARVGPRDRQHRADGTTVRGHARHWCACLGLTAAPVTYDPPRATPAEVQGSDSTE